MSWDNLPRIDSPATVICELETIAIRDLEILLLEVQEDI